MTTVSSMAQCSLAIEPLTRRTAAARPLLDPAVVEARRLEQHPEALARVEHARLHGVDRNAEDFGDLVDGFLLVVDESYHLAVLGRQGVQAAAEDDLVLVLPHLGFRIAGRIRDIEQTVAGIERPDWL